MDKLLLSYPRSGNHFVRFLIEYGTGRPTSGCVGNAADLYLCDNVYADWDPLGHVKGTPEWVKAHSVGELERNLRHGWTSGPERMILIIRNPLESIPRHIGYEWDEARAEREARMFRRNVEYFRDFDGDKLLLRYETLISPSQRVGEIRRLLGFVGTPVELEARLFGRLDEYVEACRNPQGRTWKGSISCDQAQYHFPQTKDPEQFRAIVDPIIKLEELEHL